VRVLYPLAPVLQMDKSREAMLGDDFQMTKEPPCLEPTDRWTKRKEGKLWDKKPTWWERGSRGLGRDYSGCIINICYALLLSAELVLWIKVLLGWRESSSPIYCVSILVALILPSLVLPVLAILHSVTQGRLSYSSSLLLVLPPSPLLLHLLLLHRKLAGESVQRISLAARAASLGQALVCSLPLLLLSLVTLVRAMVGVEQVDMASLHTHLYTHSLQSLAASLSFLNLLLSSQRYNERQVGRAVGLLVGLPFLFTNLSFRVVGFTLLFAYFDTPWILLFLGLHFCVSALGVQLGAGASLTGRGCSNLLALGAQGSTNGTGGPRRSGGSVGEGPGVAGSFVLSLANCVLPAGYNRDRQLGHCMGRSWRLVLVSWAGSLALHCLIIHQTILAEVPNVYTGLAPVDMSMLMPKTGLAVNLPNTLGGGFNVRLVLPQTQMTMDAEHPASYELSTSSGQDMVVALAVPILLALLTAPFTILRILLLGWNCSLQRQKEWRERDLDDSSEVSGEGAGRTRNCLTVLCSVTGMMLATNILMLLGIVYVLVIIQSVSNPLVRDLS